ncbi:ornithine cyclodeaminase [Fulvitalea axinellae]|uniref:Ornithine cyclodeaminase n=1 Tax=Fulvitalea axinellae TaxID=1182444 RepID=A0AAU9DC40_9BACT|nr:ornithine cyclodeaminase [Fulvitalea axinellae]
MRFISKEEISPLLDFPSLIDRLEQAFQGNYTIPQRHHHDYDNPNADRESTLLLMPAWEAGKHVGVKIVTVSPENGKHDLPAIQGLYLLMDGDTGTPKALCDAKTLTVKRTAAASALASRFLSAPDSKHLLMVGTGALAPELIKAHSAARPIEKVTLWGRTPEKAKQLAEELVADNALEHITFSIAENLESAVAEADIISCATLSQTPLISGKWLRPGQHLDLVGAYRPDMREADDDCILRSEVYVDTYAGATKECGDIRIPLEEGTLKLEEIRADLFELCKKEKTASRTAETITMFKSVGHALEDLTAAQLIDERLPQLNEA